MNLKALKKIDIEDYKVSKNFDNIAEFLTQLDPNPFLAGNLVSTIVSSGKSIPLVLTTTTTMVPHGLGSDYAGYIIVYQNAGASIYIDSTVTKTGANEINSKNKYIPLKATATVTVKVWVF